MLDVASEQKDNVNFSLLDLPKNHAPTHPTNSSLPSPNLCPIFLRDGSAQIVIERKQELFLCECANSSLDYLAEIGKNDKKY